MLSDPRECESYDEVDTVDEWFVGSDFFKKNCFSVKIELFILRCWTNQTRNTNVESLALRIFQILQSILPLEFGFSK